MYNEAGTQAMLATSTVSSMASFGMIFWILMQKQRHGLHSRHIVVTRLVLNLLASDFTQSVGFMMSYNWYRIKGINEGAYCDVQGFLINLGDVASGFWALVICLHTYLLVVYSIEYEHMVFLAMTVIWPFNIVISVLGFVIQQGTGKRFYGNAGGSWCWISPIFPNYRIGFHYGIILFNAAAMIVLYAIMFIVLYRRQTGSMATQSRRVLQHVNKKLVWYPIVYIVLVFPLAFQRIVAVATKDSGIWGSDYLIPAACIFTSAGLVNTIIYGLTRNIVSLKPLISRLQRLTTNSLPITSSTMAEVPLRKPRPYFATTTTITGGTTSDIEPMSSFISITTTQQVRISYIEPPKVSKIDENDFYDNNNVIITPPTPSYSAYSADPFR